MILRSKFAQILWVRSRNTYDNPVFHENGKTGKNKKEKFLKYSNLLRWTSPLYDQINHATIYE